MREVRIHASRAYTVHIEAGLLSRVGELLRPLTRAQKACIVSGERAEALYGERLEQSLRAAGFGGTPAANNTRIWRPTGAC